MDKSQAAEEKLLKLIRKKEKKITHSDVKPNRQLTASAKEQQKQADEKKSVNSIKKVNRYLIIIAIGLLGFIGSKYYLGEDQKVMKAVSESPIERKGAKIISLAEPRPYSYYQEKFSKRDIFLSPWDEPKTVGPQASMAAHELESKIKIVGIVLDEDPKAIIEDTQLKQTFFVSIGESIQGAVIEQIEETRVLFNVNGQRVEVAP